MSGILIVGSGFFWLSRILDFGFGGVGDVSITNMGVFVLAVRVGVFRFNVRFIGLDFEWGGWFSGSTYFFGLGFCF